ncbi:linear amide C-N hydrolase [Polynucleobacter necessarius]|uniref:linear amide C-N hydrolase n=1 Tax=Polynucleobacter necessarius TaxID=576610 RepID=UPI0022B26233|nr:linear amide C-N hydrolase [Polynucleobacter necessarius]
MPAATKVESITPSGAQGKVFSTKYAILAMTGNLVGGAKLSLLLDGMNDQGLSFSANAMIPSSAPPVGNDPTKILSVNDFGTWILGNHKTVAEVKASMQSHNTEFWLPKTAF